MHSNPSDIILNNLLDGVLIVNKEGKIIYSNRAASKLFNRTAQDLVGQNFGFPVSPFEVQEIEIIRFNKVLTVQMLATAIKWDGEEACLLSLRDITELKDFTRQLELRKINLEKSNEELEHYASLASHDLKEPVRKILFYTDYLLNGDNLQSVDDIKKNLGKINDAAERMRSLLFGIAEYSRYSGGRMQFEVVDLNEVVKEVLKDLDVLIAEKNAKIHVEDLPTLEAIRIQMHQLFLNIISNAIKYSKKEVDPEIKVTHTDLDSILEITISDNGIGLDNRYSEKIFKPFQRLRPREYEGSGIGLAICKKIVETHGGNIWVKSTPDKGSDFIFTLERQHSEMF